MKLKIIETSRETMAKNPPGYREAKIAIASKTVRVRKVRVLTKGIYFGISEAA